MKSFISLELPPEIKDNLFNLQNSFDKRYAKIQWVAKKNLHITLKQLGEVSDSELDIIQKTLGNIVFEPFTLKLVNVKLFYKNNNPSVIYVDIFSKKDIISLQQKIDAELLQISPHIQIFSSHVSLGRIKLIKKEKFKEYISELKFSSKEFLIDKFTLMESVSAKGNQKYNILKKFNK
ncbi:RNA 2',3'-cyclic phosphodiesterase [archaeon]|jgi:RNA 2',3'-cyclic 3'-phosphodiesterase|nr:RNA 2',3'-cyclic phosphodiesterase [archaeon]